jgi:hypothetical protein
MQPHHSEANTVLGLLSCQREKIDDVQREGLTGLLQDLPFFSVSQRLRR